MNDDLISRQAAIDALAEWHDVAITNRLNNLPPAQPSVSKTETVEDCISRQAAIDALEELKELDYELYIRTGYCHLMEDYWDFVIERYKEAIKETPCAQQKQGHWIANDDYDGDVYYTCSRCEEPWVTIEGTPQENGMRYCPHCGAKMEGETE